jgi:hypothetical protein
VGADERKHADCAVSFPLPSPVFSSLLSISISFVCCLSFVVLRDLVVCALVALSVFAPVSVFGCFASVIFKQNSHLFVDLFVIALYLQHVYAATDTPVRCSLLIAHFLIISSHACAILTFSLYSASVPQPSPPAFSHHFQPTHQFDCTAALTQQKRDTASSLAFTRVSVCE